MAKDTVRIGCSAEQTPEEFVFAAKASQYLTHMKRLRDLGAGIARYYERIEPLVEVGKLGPVVCALPGERPVHAPGPDPDGLRAAPPGT